jgi:Ca2+-binding EF-hand superfamily protein
VGQSRPTEYMRYFIIGLMTCSFCHLSVAEEKDYSDQLEKLKNKLNRYLDPDQLFKKIDKDKDNSLSIKEFSDQKAYRGQDEEKAKKTFSKIDTDRNEKISKNEFKAYRDKALSKLSKAVEGIDTDKHKETTKSIEKKKEPVTPDAAPSIAPSEATKTAEKKSAPAQNPAPAPTPAPTPAQ